MIVYLLRQTITSESENAVLVFPRTIQNLLIAQCFSNEIKNLGQATDAHAFSVNSGLRYAQGASPPDWAGKRSTYSPSAINNHWREKKLRLEF